MKLAVYRNSARLAAQAMLRHRSAYEGVDWCAVLLRFEPVVVLFVCKKLTSWSASILWTVVLEAAGSE